MKSQKNNEPHFTFRVELSDTDLQLLNLALSSRIVTLGIMMKTEGLTTSDEQIATEIMLLTDLSKRINVQAL